MQSEKILKDITDVMSLESNDIVFEIGPGQGSLTQHLIDSEAIVTSIEIDQSLYHTLENRFSSYKNWNLIRADILEIDFSELTTKKENNILVGNLPYNISKLIIRRFLESTNFSKGVFLIQREVADDYSAHEGYETFLHVSSSVYARSKYEFTVEKEYFHPMPKVDGALISFDKKDLSFIDITDKQEFIKFAKSGFSSPRKTFMNSIKSYLQIYDITTEFMQDILYKLNLKPSVRPHEINLNHWHEIFRLLKK